MNLGHSTIIWMLRNTPLVHSKRSKSTGCPLWKCDIWDTLFPGNYIPQPFGIGVIWSSIKYIFYTCKTHLASPKTLVTRASQSQKYKISKKSKEHYAARSKKWAISSWPNKLYEWHAHHLKGKTLSFPKVGVTFL